MPNEDFDAKRKNVAQQVADILKNQEKDTQETNNLADLILSRKDKSKAPDSNATTVDSDAQKKIEDEKLRKELEEKEKSQKEQKERQQKIEEQRKLIEALEEAKRIAPGGASIDTGPTGPLNVADIKNLRKAYLAAEREANKGAMTSLAKGLLSGIGINPQAVSGLFDKKLKAAKENYEQSLQHYEKAKAEQVKNILEYRKQKGDRLGGIIADAKDFKQDASINEKVNLNQMIADINGQMPKDLGDADEILRKNLAQGMAIGGDYIHEQLDKTLDNGARSTIRKFTGWFNGTGGLGKAVKSGALFGGLGFALRNLGGWGAGAGVATSVLGGIAHKRTEFDTKALLEQKIAPVSNEKKENVLKRFSSWFGNKTGKEKAMFVGKALAGTAGVTTAAVFAPMLAASVGAGMAGGAAVKLIANGIWKVGNESGAGGTYEKRMKARALKLETGQISFAKAQKEAAHDKFYEELAKNVTNVFTRMAGFAAGFETRDVYQGSALENTMEAIQQKTGIQNIQDTAGEKLSGVFKIFNPSTGKVEEVTIPAQDTATVVTQQPVTVDTSQVISPIDTNLISSTDTNMISPIDTNGTFSVDTNSVLNPVDTSNTFQVDTNSVIQPVDTNHIVNPIDTNSTAAPIDTNHVQPAPNITPAPTAPDVDPKIEIKTDAVEIPDAMKVHKGEGVTHAFVRQIEGNKELASSLGYKDGDNLHKFAINASKDLAEKFGYYSETSEVRVADVGAAYELKLDDNGAVVGVQEYDSHGVANELHTDANSEGAIEKYEYRQEGHGAQHVAHAAPTGGSEGIGETVPGGVPGGQEGIGETIPGGTLGGQEGIGETIPAGGSVGQQQATLQDGPEGVAQNNNQTPTGAGSPAENAGAGPTAGMDKAQIAALFAKLDFPKDFNYQALLSTESPETSRINDNLRNLIISNRFDYLGWFHNDTQLADAFKANPNHINNPIGAYVETILKDPHASNGQKQLSLELMARNVTHKLTPGFMTRFINAYQGFYMQSSPTIQGAAGQMVNNLGLTEIRTDLEPYEQHFPPAKVETPPASNGSTAAQQTVVNKQQILNNAVADGRLSRSEVADLQSKGILTGHEKQIDRMLHGGKVGPHELARLQRMGALPKNYVIDQSSTSSNPENDNFVPAQSKGIAYSTGTKTDDAFYDPNRVPAGAHKMTAEESANFGKPGDLDAEENAKRLARITKNEVVPGGMPAGGSEGVSETVSGGMPADASEGVGETIPGGVSGNEGVAKETVLGESSANTTAKSHEITNHTLMRGPNGKIIDHVETYKDGMLIGTTESPSNLSTSDAEEIIKHQDAMREQYIRESNQRYAESFPEAVHARPYLEALKLNIGMQAERVQEDVFAKTIIQPFVNKGYDEALITKFLTTTIGFVEPGEKYISAQDFMTHDFSEKGIQHEMSMTFKNQIHSLEKQAFGNEVKVYPPIISMRQWVELLLNKASGIDAANFNVNNY